jgi:thioredoxin-dependent peroxiredoxin
MAQISLKSTPVHTSGDLPKVGSKAPDFVLVDGELKEHSLKDFRGKRKILSIVPSLDTAVCSLSAKKFNEAMKKHPEAQVIVISADSPFAQKRVCTTEGLKNITTLSLVRSKDFAKHYGVLILDGPLAGLCARAIVVLDEHDTVLYTELVPEITHEPNYERALQELLE